VFHVHLCVRRCFMCICVCVRVCYMCICVSCAFVKIIGECQWGVCTCILHVCIVCKQECLKGAFTFILYVHAPYEQYRKVPVGCIRRFGPNHKYMVYKYNNFGREITEYTVMHGAYSRF